MTYRYLGSNNYEIKLTVYRDCSDPIDFDNPATITFFDNTDNSIFYNKQIGISHRDTIHPNNPDPCFIPPPGICVEEAYYLDTVYLPSNTSGYTTSYQRCCHNSSLLNINNPSSTGTTITTNIPAQINNSSSFLNFPPVYVCINDTFNYSFFSEDIDGDSLVYQMCSPLIGATNFNAVPNPSQAPPYIPVTWSNSFSATNPITTLGGVSFNSNNGEMSFIPTTQGQFAVGICVLEYRNGLLLNTNSLEIQFNVVPCYLVSSIPTATNLCEGLNINFQNGSSNATSYHWDFGENTMTEDTSNLFAPSYTYSNFGTYTISLIAINNSYGTCKDTTTKIIKVNPLLSPSIAPNYSECYNNNSVPLLVSGSFDSSAIFDWNLGNHASPSSSNIYNPIIHFDTLTQNISVIVSQFGCTDTLFTTINFINPIASINTANLNCNGSILHFSSFSDNSTSVAWDFGDLNQNTDTSSLINPTYNYPSYGNYTVTLIAYNGSCSDTTELPIIVNDTLSLFQNFSIEQQCLNKNSFDFFANGIYSSGASFTWLFDSTANTIISNLENPTDISFSTAGNHIVKMYVYDHGCYKQRFHVIKVLPSPVARFIAIDTIGCQPLKVNFINQSESTIPFSSLWQIDNNPFYTLDTNYIFYNSGLYYVSLIVNDTNNCTDTLKNRLVNVLPKPKAIAHVSPFKTDILSPNIEYTDNTLGTHTTIFDFGDGTTSDQLYNNHIYSDVGTYNYQLVVMNNFSCSDTVRSSIVIDSYDAIFIPNSFTPNKDGLNDVFKPIIPYYKKVILQIFNRWGELIIDTNDIERGWDGKIKGIDAPSETYIYKVYVEYPNGKEEKIIGHITLIK